MIVAASLDIDLRSGRLRSPLRARSRGLLSRRRICRQPFFDSVDEGQERRMPKGGAVVLALALASAAPLQGSGGRINRARSANANIRARENGRSAKTRMLCNAFATSRASSPALRSSPAPAVLPGHRCARMYRKSGEPRFTMSSAPMPAGHLICRCEIVDDLAARRARRSARRRP